MRDGATSRVSALSSPSWAQFAAQHWEKRPLVIRQPFVRPIATAAELFRGLVRAGRARSQVGRGLRFYNEQALQAAELGKYLPGRRDHSLGKYVARIDRQLHGRRFGLIAHDYQSYDAPLWLRLREFLHGCFTAVGYPVPWVDASVFVGNYNKTPFGVHRDDHGTFLFVIEGRKRMLAWPGKKFRNNPRIDLSLDYERHRASAITLEGQPGDIIYWPKTYWHVAESTGDLSVTLHVAVNPEMDSGRDLAQHVTRLVSTRLQATDNANLYSAHPAALQSAAARAGKVARVISDAVREVSNSATLKDDLLIAWLKRLTSGGFQTVPPPQARRRLTSADCLRGYPKFPIIWRRGKSELICAANGHVFSVNAQAAWPKLIERINSGEKFRIRDVANDTLPMKDLRAFLEKLLSLRAIVRVASRHSRAD